MKNKIFGLIMSVCLLLGVCSMPVKAAPEWNVDAESAVLMEASTGKVMYEKNGSAKLSPASITKIMTLYLIFEALENQEITLEESVATSAYASSMGGSQVFLEAGEEQTVETLIQCIIIASGNDASVVMAERLAGTEAEFVNRMNDKAMELGMTNTHFEDCCGLTMSDDHHTSAMDVAILSRRLIQDYPRVLDYAGIWMMDITHVTARGSSIFTLNSTNKLLKQYKWATGLKTGFTSKAKFCLSATASKDGVELIAVVMACPDSKTRFKAAATLLDYGYNICRMYEDPNEDIPEPVSVYNSLHKKVEVGYAGPFRWVNCEQADQSAIRKEIIMKEHIAAPIREGDVLGEAVYTLKGEELGSVELIALHDVPKSGFGDFLGFVIKKFLF